MQDSTPSTSRPIRIVIINGSARPGNFTGKAVAIVADELGRDPRVSVEVINPGALNLPLPGTDLQAPAVKELQAKIVAATAVVLATPEYHGSFSSVMKLTIENLGFPSVLSGKPVALLGVAAGAIGAIKSLEHLRGVVSHIGALALPLPISIPNVQTVFDADGSVKDPAVEKLIRRVATNLMQYIDRHICPRVTLERLLREGSDAIAQDPAA
jgi:chromate reductase, NAD(P)H dehydrogenase (quinone)